jgi:hypothetical protein
VSDWITWALVAAVVIGAIVVYLSSAAGRLDRLHHRIETAYAALDAALLRRAAATQDLASSGFLDPASAFLLSAAAQDSLAVDEGDDVSRWAAESELSRTLGAVLETREDVEELRDAAGVDAAVCDQLLAELAAACRRVELARRFHNDVVRNCTQVRRQRLVRWFRLAGYTPMPTTADFDDTPPAGLDGR